MVAKMKLTVAGSPHIRSANRTSRIMLDVIIALIPALIASCYFFGIRSLFVTATCVAFAVAAEYVTRKIMKRDNTVGDLSAVVTGILLAYNLPVSIPLWMAAVGSVFAIVVVKQFFGGIGQNVANPTITARIILMLSFSGQMTHWVMPFYYLSSAGTDAVASATPLAAASSGGAVPSLFELFIGERAGCLGETSVLALLIGFAYLLIRRVINPVVPLVYIGTVFAFSFFAGADPVYQIMSGGLMLGAIFMATDYSTSPVTNSGKAIFALGCGLITSLIRFYGSYPEGVSFSILFMNLLVPYIDKFTRTRPFGVDKNAKKKRGAKV